MHFCGDLQTVVVIFRTINFVNQLSIYGAVAEKCEELVRGFLTVLSARLKLCGG